MALAGEEEAEGERRVDWAEAAVDEEDAGRLASFFRGTGAGGGGGGGGGGACAPKCRRRFPSVGG